MTRSGREWIGDSDMNTTAADRDYLQPDEDDPLAEFGIERDIAGGWRAWRLGTEDYDMLFGYGETREEAVAELLEIERDDRPVDTDGPWSGGFAENH